MLKKGFPRILAAVLALGLFTSGCGPQILTPATTEPGTEHTNATGAASSAADETDDAAEGVTDTEAKTPLSPEERITMRVGSLKGPTTIGLLPLMHEVERSNTEDGYHMETSFNYEFTMETDPSVIAAGMISGDLDVALVPANLASVIYNRTEGGVVVVNINTLGVLECVSADEMITHVSDLAGETILTTGQGATPEYAIRFLMEQNGITDYELEFKSEAQEIAAVLQEDPSRVAVLPEPFATVATKQNEALSIRFSLAEEWDALGVDSTLVTGVTIMRRAYLEEIGAEQALWFLSDHTSSMMSAKYGDPDETASLIVAADIIGNEQIAKAALPRCGIAVDETGAGNAPFDDPLYGGYTGERMRTLLSGYLQTLYDADPASVGGALPGDDFYFAGAWQ